MSSFDLAISTLLLHEGIGGDNQDPAGSTHYGISLRFLKTLSELEENGFQIGDINHDGAIDEQDIQDLSQHDAITLYHDYWWQPNHYERIESQTLATKIFDLTVNMGSNHSHRCLQRAVRAASGHQLLEDGLLGSRTLTAVNTMDTALLLASYRSEAAGYYRSLRQPRFEKGWLNRAYA